MSDGTRGVACCNLDTVSCFSRSGRADWFFSIEMLGYFFKTENGLSLWQWEDSRTVRTLAVNRLGFYGYQVCSPKVTFTEVAHIE